ncbi:MAG: FeoA family protein [Proteobacteria bacterium]|jgi:Fe2+ transport system protein FeoA|nr:FeoA family protein [Pseudomonadota bacterium]MDA0942162.1 FeoA family protein [Pseudomonadota bacterium]MDA1034573.1 FeoA family protein [Pseudomonadota bacterium]
MQKLSNKTLSDINQNCSAKIIAIDHEEWFINKAEALGIKINNIITVTHKRKKGPICVNINTTSFMMRLSDANRIKVMKL